MVQSKGINFEGQNIYIGIDVHLKTWSVTIITESGYKRKFSQKSSARELFEYLKKHYPGGIYLAAYESGFSGFSTYYALSDLGIRCMVVHAADVPTTQYESVMKSDAVDSEKLASSLKAGKLKAIYVQRRENLDDRHFVRLRQSLQKQLSGYKSRVKHLLHNHGVNFPECFEKPGTHWSRRFMLWLREDVCLLSSTRRSLDLLLDQVDFFRSKQLEAIRQIRELARTERYSSAYQNLLSIPGVGVQVAMCLLTEIDDFHRFPNEKHFASYLGLIPTCHNTGDKKGNGEKTFRGNKKLGPMIVESAWVTIRHDSAMAAAYGKFCQRMKPQKAIIRIARKLSNRILHVLKTGKKYEYDRCV